MNDRPNALIVGAGKARVRSLYRYLASHPAVVASNPKELMYFSSKYESGNEWYQSFFPPREGAQVYLESTPQYSFRDEFPDVAKRVHDYNPEMKIIYVVRESLERVVSHFNHLSRIYPKEYKNIELSLKRPEGKKYFIERTRYFYRISAYRDFFPDSQIRVVFLEDMKTNFVDTLNGIFQFLGIRSVVDTINPCVFNKRPDQEGRVWTLDDISETRQFEICTYLKSDVQELFKFTGKTSDFWGPAYQ